MKRSVSIFKDFFSANSEKQKPHSLVFLLLSLLIAAILLYITLRGLDWKIFLDAVKSANLGYLSLLLVWSSLSYFLRALRWRVLLNSQKATAVSSIFWANMAGYLGNNILPARAGELVRAIYVAQKEKIPVAFILATGVTERFIDLVALVIMGSVAVFWLDAFPLPIQKALQSFSFFALGGTFFILLSPFFYSYMVKLIADFPILNNKLKQKILELLGYIMKGIGAIRNLHRGVSFVVFTVMIWSMDTIGMTIVALSLNKTLSLLQAFLLISALGLSSAIPSTPGYVGVYQFVTVTILANFGFQSEVSLVLILLVQLLNLIIVFFLGGVSILQTTHRISKEHLNNLENRND